MPVSHSQRLRRAAEKAARRKIVVAEKRKAEMTMTGGSREVEAAARAPVHSCMMSEGLFRVGIGRVVLARTLPLGEVAASIFLIDAYCLGIKDALFTVTPKVTFESRMGALGQTDPLIDIEPSVARKLLRDAVDFAGLYGLMPSEGFAEAEAIFGDVEMADQTFEFGKDGKPFFITGPNDSPMRIRRILGTLEKYAGPDGVDFIAGQAASL